MNVYFAPMQGVTGWPFRLTHLKYYTGVDRYGMPFISVHQTRAMKGGEKREIQPDHNVPGRMIPQLLPGKAEDTLAYMGMLRDAGYDEISLNFGCPARTVTSKGKGAGMLEDPQRLDVFLDHLFTGMRSLRFPEMKVTVKTRIGMNDCGRIDDLIRIYNRYPIAEVQVHARLGKDGYSGEADREAFRRFYEGILHPVCYNGDIRSVKDFRELQEQFPKLPAVMIGRGLVADPMLAEKIKAETATERSIHPGAMPESKADSRMAPADELQRLIRFHDDVCSAWYEAYGNEYPTICRMMEIWDYLKASFPGSDRLVRKIRKTRTLEAYRSLAGAVFRLEYRPEEGCGNYMTG